VTMAEKRRPALGRGMAALLSNAPPPPSAALTQAPAIPGRSLLMLPIEAVERNPDQPRKRFDEAQLEELAASIREHGVVEPILVRQVAGSYRILAGERRWRAAARAGLKEIPAVIREASDREAFELALVENLQRADLNAIEEAEAYEVLLTDHALTQEEIARRVGKVWPICPDSRPTWRVSVAKRCVELMGPPFVSTYTMLKSLKVKIVEKRMTMASTGLSSGSVTCQKRAAGPAPSASAAS